MTNHKKCYLRDNAIMEMIARREVLNTEQIYLLFFRGLNDGYRITQKRLKSLYERKQINRNRESFSEPFYYFTGKRSAQVNHKLGINWVYVWLNVHLKNWEEMFCFAPEQDYGILRTDALAGIKNTVTGRVKFHFVEFDNSWNNFDKVTKYNSLYDSGRYRSWWWVDYADRFPAVLIVTTNPKRQRAILERVKKENVCGLEFQVRLLDQIKEECLNAKVYNPGSFPAATV